MGTRADFYVGRGQSAEWLGSIAWDGYPKGIPVDIVRPADEPNTMTEADYRGAVSRMLAERDDATLPGNGWPWPWETSHTTDYAYAFDGGAVYACCFGHRWFPANDPALNEDETPAKVTDFPDMTAHKRVAEPGDKRSGLMVFGLRRS